MGMGNLFEDDLLDLLFTNVARPDMLFPFNAPEPRLLDAIIGTVFIMLPITPIAYYIWKWVGWL